MTTFAKITKSFKIMKKIFLLMAIVLPFVLISCGDDKDEPKSLEELLMGRWESSWEIDGDKYHNIAIFDSEHQFYHSGYKNDTQIIRASYTWELNGNTLKLIRNYDSAQSTHEITIKDNTLTISGYRETYHKVDS